MNPCAGASLRWDVAIAERLARERGNERSPGEEAAENGLPFDSTMKHREGTAQSSGK